MSTAKRVGRTLGRATTELGNALRARRIALGFTQNKASEAIGATQVNYGAWEEGRGLPKTDKWRAVMSFLEIDAEAFVDLMVRSGGKAGGKA